MKIFRNFFGVGILALVLAAFSFGSVFAQPVVVKPLAFREINITGGEFLIIQNAGSQPLDLNDYWLGYASDDEASNLVPTQQLPDVLLTEGQTILLAGQGDATCGAVYAGRLSFSLSNSAGTLELRKLTVDQQSQTATFATVDSIHWRNPSSNDPISSVDNIDLGSEDASHDVWYKDSSDPSAEWRVGDLAGCNLTVPTGVAGSGSTTITWPQASSSPAATVVNLINSVLSGPFVPAGDKGLLAPQLDELLPNPAPPKTDESDEFIELYNPNDRPFDLSGFMLQTGSTMSSQRHRYIFPAGTKLPPRSFKAFYSKVTNLTLSNDGGQAWLLDPFGNLVSQSDPYGKTKDGEAWALAKDKWYMTLTPTPDKANVVQASAGASKNASSSTSAVSGKPVQAVKGDSTKSSSSGSDASSLSDDEQPVKVNASVLALIAALALGYGVYEYRHDISNKLFQLRKYRAARRANRR